MNGQPFSTEDITSLLEENLGEDVSAINHVLGKPHHAIQKWSVIYR